MNWPSDSRNAIRTPLSPVILGSLALSLLVPTKTIPLATTGLPYACEPSSATHLMFFLVFTSHVVGSPFMLDSMLRSGVPPHIGQSVPEGSPARASSVREVSPRQAVRYTSFFMDFVCIVHYRRTVDRLLRRVPIDLDVVVVQLRASARLGWRIGVESRRSLDAANRIDALDRPGGRLGLALRPHLAARTDPAAA